MSNSIHFHLFVVLVTYLAYVNARYTYYYKETYNTNNANYYETNSVNQATSYNQPLPTLPTGDDCLTEHNRLRYRHNVEPLEYDATLEQYAIKRAKYMAKTDIFEHPRNLPYGENLYWRSGTPPTCKDASDAWYNEISLYSYKNPSFSTATGHFTQMIWKKSTHIGCAAAKSKKTGRVYIACNYWPRGNVLGKFKDNVPYPRYWFKR